MRLTRLHVTPKTEARFWRRVAYTANTTECWLWTGAKDRDGYGSMSVGRARTQAHRFAWLSSRGDIPKDKPCVLHDCDNPACCNPTHLWVGTRADNNKDRHIKRRDAAGDRNGSRVHPESRPRGDANTSRSRPWTRPRGERSGTAQLNNAQVRRIRVLYPSVSQERLAKLFGVAQATISRVIRRITWSHVK